MCVSVLVKDCVEVAEGVTQGVEHDVLDIDCEGLGLGDIKFVGDTVPLGVGVVVELPVLVGVREPVAEHV